MRNVRGALITFVHFTLHGIYDPKFPAHNFSKVIFCVHTCNFKLINAYFHPSRNYSVNTNEIIIFHIPEIR